MTPSWALTYHARPWSLNVERAGNRWKRAEMIREWREAFCWLALVEEIPPLTTLVVHAHPFYRTARSIPDTAACVGSVKAAIDGLVDAGVLTDDTPDIVRTVTFHAPVVDRSRHSDALTLWIAEYQPAWVPEKEPF